MVQLTLSGGAPSGGRRDYLQTISLLLQSNARTNSRIPLGLRGDHPRLQAPQVRNGRPSSDDEGEVGLHGVRRVGRDSRTKQENVITRLAQRAARILGS